MTTPAIRTSALGRTYRLPAANACPGPATDRRERVRRARQRLPGGDAGRAVRPARLQRRRQDDPDQDPGHAAGADQRARPRSTASTSSARPRPSASASTWSPEAKPPATACSRSARISGCSRSFTACRASRPTAASSMLLDAVGLADRGDTRISHLSTGLRQKMNFCRGLVTDPKILFLDEPTLGLDVGAARTIRQLIREWMSERPERTMILTTHYMAEADELCDRIAIIDRGKVLACDTPANLKRRAAALPDVRDGSDRTETNGWHDLSRLSGVHQCHLRRGTDVRRPARGPHRKKRPSAPSCSKWSAPAPASCRSRRSSRPWKTSSSSWSATGSRPRKSINEPFHDLLLARDAGPGLPAGHRRCAPAGLDLPGNGPARPVGRRPSSLSTARCTRRKSTPASPSSAAR